MLPIIFYLSERIAMRCHSRENLYLGEYDRVEWCRCKYKNDFGEGRKEKK